MKKAPHKDGAGKEYINALNKHILRRPTAIVIPFRGKASGFTTVCPRCGTIHFKPWRTGTQRGLFAELCPECWRVGRYGS